MKHRKLTPAELTGLSAPEKRKVEKKNRINKELRDLYLLHIENRATLASIANGDSLDSLANITSRFSGKIKYKNLSSQCSEWIIKKFAVYIATHQKDYPNIDFSIKFIPHILKQFPKLSEEQVRNTAMGVYKTTYKGMRAAEYIKWIGGD